MVNVAARPLDPTIKTMAEKWHARNNWYKPDLTNLDSKITNEISLDLMQEGLEPTDENYWRELDRRAAQFLPHRYAKAQEQRTTTAPVKKPQRQTVGGSGNNVGRTEGPSSGVRLPADTVNAWKQAGIWDDPAKRAKAIKQYSEAMAGGDN